VGLEGARGVFVTFQDSDDWAHPRRLERQIAPLLGRRDLVATHCLAVRAHDDLSHQWLGYPPQRVSASSLLFRRDAVMSRIGYFDPVRRGADTEYAFRLEAAFGTRILTVNDPLSYYRLRSSSLSRSDFTLGWFAPERAAYRSAYAPWHQAIAHGADPYLPRVQHARVFPAPAVFLDGRRSRVTRDQYDVILLDDWLSHSGPFEGAMEEILSLRHAGLSVGILHQEAIGRMTRPREQLHPHIQEAVNSGLVHLVLPNERASAALLLIRDPWVLQFASEASPKVRADRVVVTVPRPPTGYPGLAVAYDPRDCADTIQRMFGVEPRWLAGHSALVRFLPTSHQEETAPDVVLAPVAVERWATERGPRRGDRPVIGRYDADNDLTWPDNREILLQAYPQTAEVDLRILGGLRAALKVLRRMTVPPSWLVYGQDQLALRAFLNQLDFFVYFPSNRLRFPPTDLLARAMASGTVVVLPERFREFFNEAAVYCSPAELRATLRQYHNDHELYARQVENARLLVEQHHQPSAYVKQIEDLVGHQAIGHPIG
jgi:glycosyltransferase involved in cell wall biosynthesis